MADPQDEHLSPQDARPPAQEQIPLGGGPLVVRHTEMSFSGPLPPPAVLREYDSVLSGAADRIITMAEKQLEHRLTLEKTVVNSGTQNARLGIYAAVAVEGMFVAASCYLAHVGLGADAIKVLGSSAVALLGAFGFGTWSRRSERIKKQQITANNDKKEAGT